MFAKVEITDDVALSQCLRDVVALSTLPALWSGANPLRIAESLAASLYTILDPEFVYVSFSDGMGRPPLSVAQTDRHQTSADLAERIGSTILKWARENDPDDLLLCPHPSGSGQLRVSVRALGPDAELGVIAAAFDESRSPTAVHQLILNVGARQAATAVQNTHLLQALRDSEANTLKYLRQLQALTHASLTIAAAPTLEQRLQAITEQARNIIGAHQAVTSLTVSADWRQTISAVSLSPKYEQYRSYDEKPDGSGIYSLVCRLNKPLRLTQTELEAHPAWRGFGAKGHRHPPMRGWLAVPLISEGRNIGLIQVSDKHEGEFSEEDESILLQLGQFAALAIEKSRAEDEIRQNDERFRALVNASAQIVWTTNAQGETIADSPSWRAYTGQTYDEWKGWGWLDVFHPDDRERVASQWRQVVAGGTLMQTEFRVRHISGDWRWNTLRAIPVFNGDGTIREWVGMTTDITARKRAEEEFLRSSKLESIGVLAGGIAHDFNNLLTAIVGNLYLSKHSLDPAQKTYARISDAERACFRAQSLTQQLLTFARGGSPVITTCAIGGMLEDWVNFALRGSNVESRFFLRPDLWAVEADEGQLNQVINNLVINAQQAMAGGGTITITAENILVGSADGLPLPPGRYVRMAVADQGVGIPMEHLSKIFDPFFTTKAKGSGLGLTTSHTIIAKHKGHLSVESNPGRGTTCSVYLPASTGPVTDRPHRLPSLKGTGRVLFMDDDEAIRGFIKELLHDAGYEVECVRHGAEALERYRTAIERGLPFHSVILDLTIAGGMGGKETIEHLLKIDPGVKAIVSSGYSDDPVMAEHQKYGFRGRLTKPYEIAELYAALSELTDTPDVNAAVRSSP
ncbi:MAG: ATP-binding protein [Nitrospiria bacterium]